LTEDGLVVVVGDQSSDLSLGGKAGTHGVGVVLGSSVAEGTVGGDESDLGVDEAELGSEGVEAGILRPSRLAATALRVGSAESVVGFAVSN